MKILTNVLISGTGLGAQALGVTSGWSQFNNSIYIGYDAYSYSIYQYGTASNYFNGRTLFGTLSSDGSLVLVGGTLSAYGIRLATASYYAAGSYDFVVRNKNGNLEMLAPPGFTGPQGFQGVTGPQGFQGFQGVTGPQGFQGFQGLTGPQGFQGFQGLTGPQGFQGFQGLTGPQGFQGFQGLTGPQGFQGLTGPQGFQGFQGLTGPQGFQGFQGLTGPQGFQGFQGFQGLTGPQGFQGFQGLTGPQGFQGVTGPQGFQGFQGVTGPQGFQGFQGLTGPQGFQGFQGLTGPQGFQGNQGFQGFQGPTGPGTINSGTNGYVAYYSATGVTISAASILFWDSTGGRLIVGTTSNNGSRLQVSGSMSVSGDLFFTGLATQSSSNYLTINTATGRIGYATASGSGGGGAGTQGVQGPTGPSGTGGSQGPVGPQGPAGTGGSTNIENFMVYLSASSSYSANSLTRVPYNTTDFDHSNTNMVTPISSPFEFELPHGEIWEVSATVMYLDDRLSGNFLGNFAYLMITDNATPKENHIKTVMTETPYNYNYVSPVESRVIPNSIQINSLLVGKSGVKYKISFQSTSSGKFLSGLTNSADTSAPIYGDTVTWLYAHKVYQG